MTPKPCDRAFEQAEAAFARAAEKLQGAATVCVRQAAGDLARACRVFQDPEISRLRAHLTESLRGEGDFSNMQTACLFFTSPRRKTLNHRDPSPEDLIVVSAMNLEEACLGLTSGNLFDLTTVGPDTVRSRAASEEVLRSVPCRNC